MTYLKHLRRKISYDYQALEKSPTSMPPKTNNFLHCPSSKSPPRRWDSLILKDWLDFRCNSYGIIEDKSSLPGFEELLNNEQTIQPALHSRDHDLTIPQIQIYFEGSFWDTLSSPSSADPLKMIPSR
ncbi:hypothetical protein K7432_007080 [Basidiobolus ranarum]|uniref:Uncharacterized protein n=1 Tax=Basidiobolus ranarum TaxID=34480 RepID=A0ABR2WU70_9FUNG